MPASSREAQPYAGSLARRSTAMVDAPTVGRAASAADLAAELVLDVRADDLVEARFRLEPERFGTARIEIGGPAVDDPGDGCIRHVADQLHGLVAGGAPQRLDLFAHRRRETRRRNRAAPAHLGGVEFGGMQEEPYRRARARKPVPYVLGDRQHRFLTDQLLAQDVGEKPGGCGIWLAGPDDDGGQPDADAVDKSLARIVGEQQLVDRLLRTVAGEWRLEELVGNGLRERRAEHRNRGGEDEPRQVRLLQPFLPDGLKQETHAIEVDAI